MSQAAQQSTQAGAKKKNVPSRSFDGGRKAAAGFVERNRLNLSRIELRHAAGDFFVPCRSDRIIFGIVQAFDEGASQVGALLDRQG